MRASLRAAEIVIGRFFFVHRAQASRDDIQLETYEFLHATFGEFLVARLIWQVLLDIAAREAASTMSLGAAPVDDDLLHALLSFAALTARAPVVSFLAEMAANLNQLQRETLTELLVRLFRVAHQPCPARGYASYNPQLLPVPARHAAYSANLVLLAVCLAGSIRVSELYGRQAGVVASWHSQALLWRSQLNTEEWTSLVEAFTLSRLWNGEHRDVLLTLDDGNFQAPAIDPFWTYGRSPVDPKHDAPFWYSTHRAEVVHRKMHFQRGMIDDIAMHALEPLASTLETTTNMFIPWRNTCPSAAHALLDTWLLPLRDATVEERRTSYQRCARTVIYYTTLPGGDIIRCKYTAALLDRLATDEKAPTDLAADVLNMLATAPTITSIQQDIAVYFIRCAMAFLGRERDSDRRIAKALQVILQRCDQADILTVEVCVRLTELRLPAPTLINLDQMSEDTLQRIANRRPDLIKRIQWITEECAIDDG